MKTEWITINQIPTKILSCGKSVKEVNENINAEDNLNFIICIPGNPAVVEIYTEFLEELHNTTGNIVWIIGHAGHNRSSTVAMPSFEKNQELYDLEHQIKYKVMFINDFVPRNAKVTLIGHSVGAYIILELLKVSSITSRIIKSYLLFPTIEYIGDSKSGKSFMKLQKFFFILFFLTRVFNLLPLCIQNILLRVYLKVSGIPYSYLDAVRNFVNPLSVNSSVSMASQEMLQIRERNNAILNENINKIKIYYGADDPWCSISNYYNIKNDIPNIDAEICDRGFPHAFVLRNSIPMARLIVEWMNTP